MECTKLKELLSEYIDGTLDEQMKAVVEGHLMRCKACSEELASLSVYRKELGSLKSVKAPEGFLEKVHQRLERRFEFEKIMRALFVPVKIKVPLEALAVAASVLLIISIYKGTGLRPVTEIVHAPSVSMPAIIVKKPAQETIELARKEEELPEAAGVSAGVTAATPYIEEKPAEEPVKLAHKEESAEPVVESAAVVLPQPAREEKPIELALLIKPKAPPPVEYAIEDAQEAADQKKQKTEDFGVASIEGVIGAMGKRTVEKVQLAEAPLPKMPAVEGKTESSQEALVDRLNEVKRLIESFEGKIISVEYDKEKKTDLPQYIAAEIPSRHYRKFMHGLSKIGSVEGPSPDASTIAKEQVPVKIKLTYSK